MLLNARKHAEYFIIIIIIMTAMMMIINIINI